MSKRTPQDWEDLERDLHAAGVTPEEIEAGARELLAQARGHQLAQTRKHLGIGQKEIAAAMGATVARVSQIEHGDVTRSKSSPVTSRHSAGGWTSSPTSATAPSGCLSPTPQTKPLRAAAHPHRTHMACRVRADSGLIRTARDSPNAQTGMR